MSGFLKRLIFKVSPDMVIGAGFTTFFLIFAWLRQGKIEVFTSSIILPVIGMLLMIAVSFFAKRKESLLIHLKKCFRSWGSLSLMVFIYENLRTGIDQSGEIKIDEWLMRIDEAIWGIEPAIWIQKWYNPFIVDVMAAVYATYFLIPWSVLLMLHFGNHMKQFQTIVTSVVICLALGYAGYILFPASPPRFSIAESFTSPKILTGIFLHNTAQKMWDAASTASQFCAFPSLHVGLSTTGMIWAIVYRKLLPGKIWTAFFLSILSITLWFSTIYLRHHWFADIIAGWLVALVGCAGGLFFKVLWEKLLSNQR